MNISAVQSGLHFSPLFSHCWLIELNSDYLSTVFSLLWRHISSIKFVFPFPIIDFWHLRSIKEVSFPFFNGLHYGIIGNIRKEK